MQKKRYWGKAFIVLMTFSLALGICGCEPLESREPVNEIVAEESPEAGDDSKEKIIDEVKPEDEFEVDESAIDFDSSANHLFALTEKTDESEYDKIEARVEPIVIEEGFANVINADSYEYQGKDFAKHIMEDHFVVRNVGSREFFEGYEFNRYIYTPNFVTVDSLMHTYHVYFAYLLRSIELKYISRELTELSEGMVKKSYEQYRELKESEWEAAAIRNVAYFAVANKLLNDSYKIPDEVKEQVLEEIQHIEEASDVDISPVMGFDEEYAQYKPRGYYEGNEELERYFRAMMWYGRMGFLCRNEDMNRSAILINKALDGKELESWKAIYSVTGYFAGASDDLGYYEYSPIVKACYGDGASLDKLEDEARFETFCRLVNKLEAPRINSVVIHDGDDNVVSGFRFMGQRFSIDAAIMQKQVYSSLKESKDGDRRMLPDVLDLPAALGSDLAYGILKEQGVDKYEDYEDNLNILRKEYNNDEADLWQASLSGGWLHTLRPLLDKKPEGYPDFMLSDNWGKKNLETFAGSFTELKHDTVLYSKQVMAELGGGWEEDIDDRGYVEPEIKVYSRFLDLTNNTIAGLEMYGYLDEADKGNLEKLAAMAEKLRDISVKELKNELLSDEEYDFIREYGGNLEHLWLDAMRAWSGQEYPSTDEYPAALVVDIASDPNGRFLELAIGDPSVIYVAVAVDGKIRICEGAVYNFYQFEQPMDELLTDSQWRKWIGVEIDDYTDPTKDMKKVDKPEWTCGYRYSEDYDWY